MSKFNNKVDSEVRKNELGKEIVLAISRVNEKHPELNEREVTLVLLKEAQAINQKELNSIL